MTLAANPYLQGNYAPVLEEVTATDLARDRRHPRGAGGATCATGPTRSSAPEPATYHWFTGDGMVHGIRLRDGRAEWYRNRWVRSRRGGARLGEKPRPGPVHGRHGLRAQHQRHRACGAHVRHRGGGRAALRADRRARDRSGRATSAARSRAATRPTPSATRGQASSTPCPTSSAGATTSRSPLSVPTPRCARPGG